MSEHGMDEDTRRSLDELLVRRNTPGQHVTPFELGIALTRLAKERSRLQATIDRLPTYADTGERFVPGRDRAYIVYDHQLWMGLAAYFSENDWMWALGGMPNIKKFLPGLKAYSTPEAAEAARDSQ